MSDENTREVTKKELEELLYDTQIIRLVHRAFKKGISHAKMQLPPHLRVRCARVNSNKVKFILLGPEEKLLTLEENRRIGTHSFHVQTQCGMVSHGKKKGARMRDERD